MSLSTPSQPDPVTGAPMSPAGLGAAPKPDESGETTQGHPADRQTNAPNPPKGCGHLARRIRSRTTDLIAISIVLIAGLTVGRQVSRWWPHEPAEVGPQVITDASGDPQWGTKPVLLEFGDDPRTISREVIAGDRSRMLAGLADKCVRIVSTRRARPGPFHPAEKRLLEQTRRLKPIDEKPGVWEVYTVELPLTLVIGTRYFKQPAGSRATDASPAPPKTAATMSRRVVCWGFGFPSDEQTWTLYTVQSNESPGAGLPVVPKIGLPDDSRRILRIRDSSGGVLTAFEGEGRAEDWIRSFSNWFRQQGWRAARGWEQSPNCCSATFVLGGEGEAFRRADVSFCRVGETGLSGIISISPSATDLR